MRYIADLHIHSHYSMATSKELRPEFLDYWAKIKGIKVVGTGDFTHPKWVEELKEKLEPAEEGLYKLKPDFKLPSLVPETPENEVRFLLTAEISNIYKKNGIVRKIHSVILAPDFKTVEAIQEKLSSRKFNITSDGRPILGLDVKNLLEMVLDINPGNFFIPAHIWTPWFSVFGSKSGFNKMEECFEDLSDQIYAVETGLSTDPPMNWMCSFLDKYTLVSNSDAHSPEKLGRNANLFKCDLSYEGITNALKSKSPEKFGGTFDMFPQEGKYHYDGHRKCGIQWSPVETLKHRGICPVCGKKVTVGVTNRVVELSDREDITQKENRLPFYSIIPLKEMLAEIEGVGEKSKKIGAIYENLIKKLGTEFNILHFLPLEEIRSAAGDVIAEGIRRMRSHEVIIKEGFDGEYGEIKVFRPDEVKYTGSQNSLFKDTVPFKPVEKRKLINFDLAEYRKLEQLYSNKSMAGEPSQEYAAQQNSTLKGLNPEQIHATQHWEGTSIVVAGPGTGKTRVLTSRIAYLVNEKQVRPQNILAITFTNKASEEMHNRLQKLLKNKQQANELTVSTFHAFGYRLLNHFIDKSSLKPGFSILDEDSKIDFITDILQINATQAKKYAGAFTFIKQELKLPEEIEDKTLKEAFETYRNKLQEYNVADLDDLVYIPVTILNDNPPLRENLHEQYKWILVDEFQDINKVQYHFLQMLTNKEANPSLFAIGDPNQSIYGFRGSSARFISKFIEDYKQTRIYKLNTSYRCSNNILRASGDVLQQEGLSGLNEGVKIKIAPQSTDKSEAEYIARKIEQLSGGLRFFSMDSQVTQGEGDENIESLSDFAILCRTKAQMKAIQKALLDHTIPYQVIAEDEFFKHPYTKMVKNILEQEQNSGNKFIKKKLQKNLQSEKLTQLFKKIQSTNNVHDKLEYIIAELDNKDNGHEEVINKLRELGKRFNASPEKFLEYLSLGKEQDIFEPQAEKVTVMTLHASKGLEFKCVFIAGCENGLIPYSLYKNQETDREEEQRLLYVGMTRAQEYLYLTHARKRFLMGQEKEMQRSPFLNRIERELTEIEKNTYKRKNKDDGQLKLF